MTDAKISEKSINTHMRSLSFDIYLLFRTYVASHYSKSNFINYTDFSNYSMPGYVLAEQN